MSTNDNKMYQIYVDWPEDPGKDFPFSTTIFTDKEVIDRLVKALNKQRDIEDHVYEAREVKLWQRMEKKS